MREQFDKLREWVRASISPIPAHDIETARAAVDIAEQVVADLHRIADAQERIANALETRNLYSNRGGGA